EGCPFGKRAMALAAKTIQVHGGERAGLAYEPFRAADIAGRGCGAVRASSAVTGFAANAHLTDRHAAIGSDKHRAGGVTSEAAGDRRPRALRPDRLAHGLMEIPRRQRVVTGRKREGSRARIVAEGMLQVELVAHPADERDRMLARS